jgi:hypothetical protein
MEVDIPIEDRAMVRRLLTCSLEEFFTIKYSWADEDLPDEEDAREVRETLLRVYRTFRDLPVGTDDDDMIIDLHLYDEDMFVDRNSFPSFNTYKDELQEVKRDLGLADLDEICEIVANGLRFRQLISGAGVVEVNPLIKLRNRRELLISRVSELDGDGHDFSWSDIKSLRWRLQSSFRGKLVLKDSFLDLLDLLDLPSLFVPILTFDR